MSIQLGRAPSQDGGSESGYDSIGSSVQSLQTIYFSPPHLKYINAQLQELEPEGKIQTALLVWSLF